MVVAGSCTRPDDGYGENAFDQETVRHPCWAVVLREKKKKNLTKRSENKKENRV
jgi:hypothetical protein